MRPLDRETLAQLLARFDVGRLLDYRPASHGIENSNYFLTTSKDGEPRRWVLTVLERPPNSGSSYVPLLDLCHEAGLPVAPVVRNAAGCAIETLEGKAAMLAPMLPGAHVDVSAAEQVDALGRFIGRFHRATAGAVLDAPAYPRDARWLRDRGNAVRRRLAGADARLVAGTVERVAGLLRADTVAELPTGFVHGDLFRDNVLFDGSKLTGVVDFHHAARGTLVYDLAVAANDWCSDAQGVLDPSRATALVDGYRGIRPLAPTEVDSLAGFLLYAALAFWLSRLTAALDADADATARRKDPDEFKAIVMDRSAHLARYEALFQTCR